MMRRILTEPGVAANAIPPVTDDSAYLLERPELMLTVLDLMEKFVREGETPAGRERRNRHAP